jgi:hypothetical protein
VASTLYFYSEDNATTNLEAQAGSTDSAQPAGT